MRSGGGMPLWLKLPLIAGLAVLAGLAFREVLRGGEKERRIDLLEAECRLLDWKVLLLDRYGASAPFPPVLEDVLLGNRRTPRAGGMAHARERGKRAIDPWEESLRYAPDPDGGGFAIRSAGPDGRMDTADDLVAEGRAGEDTGPALQRIAAATEERNALLRELSARKRRGRGY